MAITVTPNPRMLGWSNFKPVDSLDNDEDAHIDMDYTIPTKNLRKVDGKYKLAETFAIVVKPVAKVLRGANKTPKLLAHEQSHYEIGILVGWAMARDLEALEAETPAKLGEKLTATFDLHRQTRMKPVQDKYDDDTDHSKIKGEQDRWNALIKTCMDANPKCGKLDGLEL
jgi:hypothetical protein